MTVTPDSTRCITRNPARRPCGGQEGAEGYAPSLPFPWALILYGVLESRREKARVGQARAIVHSLQFTQTSWRICRCIAPLPNVVQPFTHLEQPTQRDSSIRYS